MVSFYGFFFSFRGVVTVDQSPSIQRILATNPDLTYSGNDSNCGSSVNGICNSGDTADASLHAIFLELSEKHMAEQLTRLDTVRYLNRFFHFSWSSSRKYRTREREKGIDVPLYPSVAYRFWIFSGTQELFKRVIPYQCLGAVWSRRDRDKGKIGKGARSSEASSVAATVEQFNAVSYRVISTILIGSSEPRSQQRARVIAKWIDVAQVRFQILTQILRF